MFHKSLRTLQDMPCVKISSGNSLALACNNYLKLGLLSHQLGAKQSEKIMFKQISISVCAFSNSHKKFNCSAIFGYKNIKGSLSFVKLELKDIMCA